MYATDVRQTDVRQKHRLMPLPCGGGGITNLSAGLVEQSTAAEHLEAHHYIARTLAISNGAALHPNSLFIVSLINHQIVFNSKRTRSDKTSGRDGKTIEFKKIYHNLLWVPLYRRADTKRADDVVAVDADNVLVGTRKGIWPIEHCIKAP